MTNVVAASSTTTYVTIIYKLPDNPDLLKEVEFTGTRDFARGQCFTWLRMNCPVSVLQIKERYVSTPAE